MMTSTVPPALNTVILPALGPVPVMAVTAFGIVRPGTQFRLDTNGFGVGAPPAHIERNDDAEVLVTVVLVSTAAAVDGMPLTPATVTGRLVPAPHGVS